MNTLVTQLRPMILHDLENLSAVSMSVESKNPARHLYIGISFQSLNKAFYSNTLDGTYILWLSS